MSEHHDAPETGLILQIQANILTKEYEILWTETHLRLGFFFQVYQVFVIVLGAVYGYMVANRHWDILILFPWIALSLYVRIIWDQIVVRSIDQYLRTEIDQKLASILNISYKVPGLPDVSRSRWIGWFDFFPAEFEKHPKLYKHSIFLVFGVISMIPSMLYIAYNATAVWFSLPLLSELSSLVPWQWALFSVMTGSFGVFFAMFVWIGVTTYAVEY